MVRRLFERLFEDDAVYESCERFWRDIVTALETSLGISGDWQAWIPRSFADGTPIPRDGNPIIDRRSQRENRGFRVMQHAPTDNQVEIVAWVKTIEPEFWDTMPAHELFIALAASEESVSLAEALLRQWMTPATTPEEIIELIRRVIPKGG